MLGNHWPRRCLFMYTHAACAATLRRQEKCSSHVSCRVVSVRFVCRFVSFRFVSFRFGSFRFGSVRFGSVRFGSVRFGSARFGSVRFGSARLGSARRGCSSQAGAPEVGLPEMFQMRDGMVYSEVMHGYLTCSGGGAEVRLGERQPFFPVVRSLSKPVNPTPPLKQENSTCRPPSWFSSTLYPRWSLPL